MGYPNRAAIAALTATAGDDVYLSEADREGRFVFSNADLSAFVAVDTAQGIFVAPAATPSGVSGAWIRQYQHFWDVRWFGAIADDQSNGGTDNLSAINAMLSTAAAVGEARTNDPTFNGLIGCDFPGFYYCSALINLKTPMHLRGLATGMGGVVGGSRLRFPAGGAGIVVNRSDTTGYTPTAVAASTGSDGSILQGLSLQAGDGSRPSAGTTHGILLRARATIQECYVTGFAGTGIAIYADNGSNPMWGNASGFHIRGGRIQNCGVHGLHIKGSDTNGGDVTGLDTYGNGQWGKLDESFLANTFVAGQDAGNGLGAYVCFPSAGQVYACRYGQEAVASSTQSGTNSTIWWPVTGLSGGFPTWVTGGTYHSAGPYHINGSTALHPYTEGGQGPSEAGISSVVVGGLHGSDNLGPRIFGSQGKVWLQGGFNSNDVSQLGNALWFSSNNSFQGGAGGGPGSLGFIYKNDTDGIVIYGGGTARDVTLLNRAGSYVFWISPNSTQANFGGTLAISGNAIVGGAVSSTSPTLGIGYATGAGGAVTQLTSKSTGVTINKICGRITTNASALASNTTVTFVVTNSALAASDVVSVALKSGNAAAGTYLVWTEAVSAGSFKINLRNISASSLSESLVLNFVVVKAVSA